MEKTFSSATLSIVVPETSLAEPPQERALVDGWLENVSSQNKERNQAFYDEKLESLLLVRLDVSGDDPANPPNDLLVLLARVQISFEASYISASAGPAMSNFPGSPMLMAPPRSQSLLAPPGTPSGGNARPSRPRSASPSHPSIFPPATPNPTPFAAEQDKRYISAEGTPLLASFWGQDETQPSREAFWLLYSAKERRWIAVYRLAFTVAFLRLQYNDPLLCITVSTTFRERPLNVVRFPDHPISVFLALHSFNPQSSGHESGELPEPTDSDLPPLPPKASDEDALDGLVEVNLLEGLGANSSFKAGTINLPSTRLGTISRTKHFLLPYTDPTTPSFPSPGPVTAMRAPATSTMKKSFRKTLLTVSGFRVRMRTVFVPAFMLPSKRKLDSSEKLEEWEDPDASVNDERTVVLCVEIENSGEAGPLVGFQIEKIDVKIQSSQSKNGQPSAAHAEPEAEARLIGWGEGFTSSDGEEEQKTFPLSIGAHEQYNLLYAVTFLRNPAEDLKEVLGASHSQADMQRAVALEIFGRPALTPSTEGASVTPSFPTPTFASKWNCILDLAPATQQASLGLDIGGSQRDILPEPASPFPGSLMSPPSRSGQLSAASRSPVPQRRDSLPPPPPLTEKRHTMPPVAARAMGMKSPPLRPASSALFQHRLSEPFPRQQSGSPRLNIMPPSISAALSAPRSPTTYGPPVSSSGSLSPVPAPLTAYNSSSPSTQYVPSSPPIPMTPAYPAYPHDSGLPQTPMSTGPRIGGSVTTFQSSYGETETSSVEIRREKGVPMIPGSSFAPPAASKVPQTPTPIVTTSGGEAWGSQTFFQASDISGVSALGPGGDLYATAVAKGEIVISVGLLPSSNAVGADGSTKRSTKLLPFDRFTLDIFVYNQSSRTRRLELACPVGARRRKANMRRKRLETPQTLTGEDVGVLPLANRVRVGPLLPSTCQSVRLEFMAISPGIHAIDTLTLTDVESGSVVNLRSIMDIVVHESGSR